MQILKSGIIDLNLEPNYTGLRSLNNGDAYTMMQLENLYTS